MSDQHLATYLNDHLAGSVAAIAMLEHLESAPSDAELRAFAVRLKAEIVSDQQELTRVMGRLHVQQSTTRQGLGWIAEKFARLKLLVEDSADGDFLLFEYLEALSLGIEGKHTLWATLAAVDRAAGQHTNYQQLLQRAREQRERVDEWRLSLAMRTLTFAPS